MNLGNYYYVKLNCLQLEKVGLEDDLSISYHEEDLLSNTKLKRSAKNRE